MYVSSLLLSLRESRRTGFSQAVLSFHACGGNVGDTTQIPLPSWVLQVSYSCSCKGHDRASMCHCIPVLSWAVILVQALLLLCVPDMSSASMWAATLAHSQRLHPVLAW